MRNLNLILRKLYYRRIRCSDYHDDVRELTEQMLKTTFDHARDYRPMPAATHTAIFRVRYPGLLTGINMMIAGGTHEDVDVDFSIDPATGQPVVHGWTLKGLLRSHFTNRAAAVAEIAGLSIEQVKELKKDLFDGNDVFFGAVVFDGDDNHRILDLDFFCHHSIYPTADPTPLRILKLMPNVRLEFRFILHDGVITADETFALIKELLLVFGVGARTNVGYGRLLLADGRLFDNRERVRCPHCGTSNYKFHPNGARRNKCYKCREYFPQFKGGVSDE